MLIKQLSSRVVYQYSDNDCIVKHRALSKWWMNGELQTVIINFPGEILIGDPL